MRLLIGLCALALLVSGPILAQEIVVYDSINEGVRCAVDAGNAIGANVHAYENGQEAAWIADVADGADIVVFDCNSNYTVRSDQLDAMANYLNTYPGGKAVCALWFMGYESGHPLWQIMDVQHCTDFSTTMPIYPWMGHPIWNGIPNPINNEETYWYVDGSMVEPIGGGMAIGGFAPTSTYCQAGLVLNSDCSTVYIGETGRGGTYDDDADGVRDWVELYINIYNYLLNSPSPVEESTWGEIKSLFR